jgi:hypothetical protein
MLSCAEVSPRMAIFGRIAAADMAAFQAHTQVHPGVASLQAVFTTLGRRLNRLYMVFYMAARCLRHNLDFLSCLNLRIRRRTRSAWKSRLSACRSPA